LPPIFFKDKNRVRHVPLGGPIPAPLAAEAVTVSDVVQGVLSEEEIPRTESLQDLVERTLPLWRKAFKKNMPFLKKILVLKTDKKENKIFLI
jgi:bisphosphoglycerate-dependent phosphoglycerate mutase